ncbi:MAG: NTPase [Acidobacteria bacterium]|nr:NTPase [Acidobacteriota bacterium]
MNLLLTGRPGVGKTTLIKKLAARLPGNRIAGFYTEEIREGGVRKGFRIVTLDGGEGLLAHVDVNSPWKVSRYRVDVAAFEKIALPSLEPGSARDKILLIDEIGKMECCSAAFQKAVWRVLDSACPVVAAVAQKGSGFIAHVKDRKDVELVPITVANRDSLLAELEKRLL